MLDPDISTGAALRHLSTPEAALEAAHGTEPRGALHELDRRRFLQLVGMGVGAGAVSGPGTSILDSLLGDRADTAWAAGPIGPDDGILVVLGMYTAVGGFIGFMIEPNMGRIMSDVRLGTFDYVLTKPVDSQVLATLREFRLWRLIDVVVGAGVAAWGVIDLSEGLAIADIVGFVVTVLVGMILVYCIWLIVTTGAFWFVRMDMVQDLFTGMYRAGQYPVTVYPVWLRLILTYLIPIGFAITVPSESLTGRLTVSRVVIAAGFLVLAMLLTRLVWKTGTKRYSGASA